MTLLSTLDDPLWDAWRVPLTQAQRLTPHTTIRTELKGRAA